LTKHTKLEERKGSLVEGSLTWNLTISDARISVTVETPPVARHTKPPVVNTAVPTCPLIMAVNVKSVDSPSIA
jgi:hypothetical protein